MSTAAGRIWLSGNGTRKTEGSGSLSGPDILGFALSLDQYWNILDRTVTKFNNSCLYRTIWCQRRTSSSMPTIRFQNWGGGWSQYCWVIITCFSWLVATDDSTLLYFKSWCSIHLLSRAVRMEWIRHLAPVSVLFFSSGSSLNWSLRWSSWSMRTRPELVMLPTVTYSLLGLGRSLIYW